jgi:hypothetical protein
VATARRRPCTRDARCGRLGGRRDVAGGSWRALPVAAGHRLGLGRRGHVNVERIGGDATRRFRRGVQGLPRERRVSRRVVRTARGVQPLGPRAKPDRLQLLAHGGYHPCSLLVQFAVHSAAFGRYGGELLEVLERCVVLAAGSIFVFLMELHSSIHGLTTSLVHAQGVPHCDLTLTDARSPPLAPSFLPWRWGAVPYRG